MDEIKAIYTGMAVGGLLGGGAVIAGTFAVPVVGPVVGTFLFIGHGRWRVRWWECGS